MRKSFCTQYPGEECNDRGNCGQCSQFPHQKTVRKFVDTEKNAKEREAMRKRIAEIQKAEAQALAKQEAIRAKHRKIGQHQLGSTTLSHFGK